MVEQEIEYCGSEEKDRGNPFEICLETPVSRHDEPHIKYSKNSTGCAHEIAYVRVQPIFDKWTDKTNDGEAYYAKSD